MLSSILAIIWLHFLGDFILQTDKMATNKSTSNKWLLIHTGVYTLPLFLLGWKFALINGAAHGIVDFVTSRLTSKAYQAGKRGLFFKIIGADQAIHFSVMVLTLNY